MMDSILKLHANSYEHIKVDELSSMPMIKLKDVKEFLRFAKKCGTGFVCVYGGGDTESGKFFITVNGVIYWIPN